MMSLLTAVETPTIVVIGKESVGKSQLVSSLTGHAAGSGNFRGTTVECEEYHTPQAIWIDTPGILRQSDTETTRLALQELEVHETVLLVVQATHLDDDLRDMLPLVEGRHVALVVTFWDKVNTGEAAVVAINRLATELGVDVLTVDARRLTVEDRERIRDTASASRVLKSNSKYSPVGWRIEPRASVFERPVYGPLMALALLLLPSAAAVYFANAFAAMVDPLVAAARLPMIAWLDHILPAGNLLRDILTGDYGLLTMGPMLFVWAVPTILLYAFLLAAYKASGLVERINSSLHPLLRPFGLSGRDMVRVIMGFGCNVPAVLSTRACSSCSRGTAISAIAFGAACSYQFPATLAVFAAVGKPWLAVPFLLYLCLTTLVYLRLTAPAAARSPLNILMIEHRTFLEWPRLSALWREARGTLSHFFLKALPVFLTISVSASILGWLGILSLTAQWLGPVVSVFHLPAEAALPIVVASIRKDGILLFVQNGGLVAPMTSAQILTSVYLAGVLLPCLVTALTIAREKSLTFAGGLLLRQALAAVSFSLVLAWGGWWLGT